MKGDFCYIEGFIPSSRTEEAIEEMNKIMDLSTVLERLISWVPFFQIFAGRGSAKGARSAVETVTLSNKGWQVQSSDWQMLHDALKAIPDIRRNRLELIARNQTLYATGEELKFWECVYNAIE